MDAISQFINAMVEERDESQPDEYRMDIEQLKKEQLARISTYIFDIASTNKFYSEVYARLYKDLIVKFNTFDENITPFLAQYIGGFTNIEFIDSNVDYDKYCDNNKANDKRKALSAFVVNLMKQDILQKKEVFDIILDLQRQTFEYICRDDLTHVVDEITENVFIMITAIKNAADDVQWEKIMENIGTLSKYKAKDYPSLSSRALFKYMDMK